MHARTHMPHGTHSHLVQVQLQLGSENPGGAAAAIAIAIITTHAAFAAFACRAWLYVGVGDGHVEGVELADLTLVEMDPPPRQDHTPLLPSRRC
jgi:hypothetical protein